MNEALVVMVRGIIAFFTLLIFARLLGKQQISQLTFFDYVLGITIGSIAANLTTGPYQQSLAPLGGLGGLDYTCIGFTVADLEVAVCIQIYRWGTDCGNHER